MVFKNYSLFASVRLAERILLGLVCGLVMVSCWFFGMGAHELETASDYDLRYRYLRCKEKLLPQTSLILTVCLSRIAIPKPSSVREEGYQSRTNPATTSQVTNGTETYPTRVRKT